MVAHESPCRMCEALKSGDKVLFQNKQWAVRSAGPPYAVAGWIQLVSRRHVPSVSHMDEVEVASLGPTLRHLEAKLLFASQAPRVYLAALGESTPHFHCHLVPRHAVMPGGASGFAVFDLERQMKAGELKEDRAGALLVLQRLKQALAEDPLPDSSRA